jgi:hypothetical protein
MRGTLNLREAGGRGDVLRDEGGRDEVQGQAGRRALQGTFGRDAMRRELPELLRRLRLGGLPNDDHHDHDDDHDDHRDEPTPPVLDPDGRVRQLRLYGPLRGILRRRVRSRLRICPQRIQPRLRLGPRLHAGPILHYRADRVRLLCGRMLRRN